MRAVALILALAFGAPNAWAHPMLGTWVGYLPNDPEDIVVELTFTHVDDAGLASGMLCHVWRYLGITYVWDLGVGPGTAATPEQIVPHRLAFTFAFNDTDYTAHRTGPKTITLHLARGEHTNKLQLIRTDPTDAPCSSRVRIRPAHGGKPRTEPPDTSQPHQGATQ